MATLLSSARKPHAKNAWCATLTWMKGAFQRHRDRSSERVWRACSCEVYVLYDQWCWDHQAIRKMNARRDEWIHKEIIVLSS